MFWIKHIILAVVIISIAVLGLLFDPTASDTDMHSSGQGNGVIEDIKLAAEAALKRHKQAFHTSSSQQIEPLYPDEVILLEPADEPVAKRIIAMRKGPQLSNSFEGSEKVRGFDEGATLMQKTREYVEQEGLELIWDLPQDFVIQSRFSTKWTLLEMLDTVARSIDVNFPSDISVFLCRKKHTIVVTASENEYLSENCEVVEY